MRMRWLLFVIAVLGVASFNGCASLDGLIHVYVEDTSIQYHRGSDYEYGAGGYLLIDNPRKDYDRPGFTYRFTCKETREVIDLGPGECYVKWYRERAYHWHVERLTRGRGSWKTIIMPAQGAPYERYVNGQFRRFSAILEP